MKRTDLKEKAKVIIDYKTWMLVGVYAAFTAIMGALSSNLSVLILGGPFIVGFIHVRSQLINNKTADFKDLFAGFNNFGKNFVTYLLQNVYILLWSLLLIIPGIIKTYSYSQAMYIIHDHPDYSPKQALALSQKMMNGHKWELFKLHLSFIPWFLLCIITFGILNFFYVGPYYNTTLSLYYEYLKSENNMTIE